MLILTRKLGERIKIGEDVWVTIVGLDRGRIRLGIEAPKDRPIYREELLPSHQQHVRPYIPGEEKSSD